MSQKPGRFQEDKDPVLKVKNVGDVCSAGFGGNGAHCTEAHVRID